MTSVDSFDPSARFIRIVDRRADGMVEFEFAVGEPDIYVEMILPAAEFAAFCAEQGVTPTDAPRNDAALGELARELGWNLKSARDDAGHRADAPSATPPSTANPSSRGDR